MPELDGRGLGAPRRIVVQHIREVPKTVRYTPADMAGKIELLKNIRVVLEFSEVVHVVLALTVATLINSAGLSVAGLIIISICGVNLSLFITKPLLRKMNMRLTNTVMRMAQSEDECMKSLKDSQTGDWYYNQEAARVYRKIERVKITQSD